MATTDMIIPPSEIPLPAITTTTTPPPPTESLSTIASSSSAAVVHNDDDDCFEEDGCSICLEPFTSTDPLTVTSCKHEYHLQCILEWSQRSKECPICWQLFVLKDPASQELLAAVETERMMRSRRNVRLVNQDNVNHRLPSIDEYDRDERLLRHFAAAKSLADLVNRRRRQSPRELGPSQIFPSQIDASNIAQVHGFPEDNRSSSYGVEVGLPASVAPASSTESELLSNRTDGPTRQRIFFGQTPPDGPQKSGSSELVAFSESVKAKLSAASAKYKESFSKSTRGFKEKLLARNSSVKELSKGVQREMTAGIIGVAKMIERLELSSKRTSDTVPLSSFLVETSDLTSKGKEVEQSATAQPLTAPSVKTTQDRSSGVSFPTPLLSEAK